MDLFFVSDNPHTGGEHLGDSRQPSELVGCKSSLQLEVEENYSPPSTPRCLPAGPSVWEDVRIELQSEDEETFETCHQKHNSATPGVFDTSSTNLDLQSEDKDLEFL